MKFLMTRLSFINTESCPGVTTCFGGPCPIHSFSVPILPLFCLDTEPYDFSPWPWLTGSLVDTGWLGGLENPYISWPNTYNLYSALKKMSWAN